MTRWLTLELIALTVLAAVGMAASTWFDPTGGWGWTWDALNHHVYLGLVAERPRWQLDVLAASYQSYQHPYLYWPVYRISMMAGDGQLAAALWTGTQAALVLPPTWFCARALINPSDASTLEVVGLRSLACLLALLNGVVLLGMTPSSNDLMAAWPLLCGIALHLNRPRSGRHACWAAAFWGASVALKWSNGLMLPLLLFWACSPLGWQPLWKRWLFVTVSALAGFGIVWAPWGVQLWEVSGNPFYPYFQGWFGGYRV